MVENMDSIRLDEPLEARSPDNNPMLRAAMNNLHSRLKRLEDDNDVRATHLQDRFEEIID